MISDSLLFSKDTAAQDLAHRHFRVEEGLTQVFRLKDRQEVEQRPGEPIKLLEINSGTIPIGIMPLHFGPVPSRGIPYATIIVEVTPDEFEKIQTNQLKLPNDWTIGEEILKPLEAD